MRTVQKTISLVCFLFPVLMMAQTINIKGKITDLGGEPLIGASILEKETNSLYGLGVDGIGIYTSDLAISGRVSEFDYSPFESNAQNGTEAV